ncbi:unnamed protein product [Schistosoma rodhaini]|uniref:Uncharacterized protein n=1 Tax=Schistosoma rodhaini TaxID=6188 RepID=A0AA85FMZ9_9TREM|nr:unnamed protein product [Schistosoma rodhaini]
MSVFNGHHNDYLKKEINGLRKWKINGEQIIEKSINIQENGKHSNNHDDNHEGILQNEEQNNPMKNGCILNENENGTKNDTLKIEKFNDDNNHSYINGDNNDNFVPICKPGRFICRGLYTDIPHLCSETGYLIWIEPKQTMHVLFTYGDTNCDFLCYLEPEVPGVAINYLEPNRIKHFQYFNENDYRPIQIHSGLAASINGSTGTRYSCMGSLFNTFSYAIYSENAQCFIELNVLNKKQMSELTEPISRPFKLNFRLVL